MSTVNEVIKAAESGTNLVFSIFDRIEKARKLKDQGNTILRMLYLEVSWNLDLLDIVNWRKLNNSDYQNASLKELITRLENSVAEVILINASEEGQKDAFKVLRKKGGMENSAFEYDNVLQNVSFYFLKIRMLKEIIQLNNAEMLTSIKIHTRLRNIQKRLVELKLALNEFEELKELKR